MKNGENTTKERNEHESLFGDGSKKSWNEFFSASEAVVGVSRPTSIKALDIKTGKNTTTSQSF